MERADLKYLPNPPIPSPDGIPQIWEWVWEGDSQFAYISTKSLHYAKIARPNEGDVIILGGYRVRILERVDSLIGFLCVRESWLGVPRLYSYRTARFFKETWQKILWTMVIWGLAKEGPQRLTWRDIKLVKWLSKWGKHS
jgi:hypothetical protein